jgi:hypothetical protein
MPYKERPDSVSTGERQAVGVNPTPPTSNPKVRITSCFHILIRLGNGLKTHADLDSCAEVNIISIAFVKSQKL